MQIMDRMTDTVTFVTVSLKSHKRTHLLTALCPGLPGWASTRKVKPMWILLKQETLSGSGISWAICKSAPHSRQITMPAPHRSVFYRPDALPAAQPTASKHWRKFWCFMNRDINQMESQLFHWQSNVMVGQKRHILLTVSLKIIFGFWDKTFKYCTNYLH